MIQLITGDLHLTNKAVDAYRWSIFDTLKDTMRTTAATQLIVLGDLTEEKDNHSSVLVNRLVEEFCALRDVCVDGVYILQGNHDFSSTEQSYWQFLEAVTGISYINTSCYASDCEAWFVPYGEPLHEDIRKDSVLFMHDLIIGASFQNAPVKKGYEPQALPDLTISGHLHKPQDILKRRGLIYYVGAPHSVDFGDHFAGRVLLRETAGNMIREVKTNGVVKWSVTISSVKELAKYNFCAGDFVKVRFTADTENISGLRNATEDYLIIKDVTFSGSSIEKLNIESLQEASKRFTSEFIFDEYCKTKSLDETYIESARQFMS